MDLTAVGVGGLAEARRDGVDMRLHAPDGLRRAEPTEGAAWERMGARDASADDNVVAAVGQGAVENAAEHNNVGYR